MNNDWIKKLNDDMAKRRELNDEKTKYKKLKEYQGSLGGLSKVRKDSKKQSEFGKLGGKKGYAQMFKNLVEQLGSEEAAKKYLKDHAAQIYGKQSEEWKKEFHSKGGNTTQEKYGAGYHLLENAKKDPDQIKRAQAASQKARAIVKDKERTAMLEAMPEGWFTRKQLDSYDIPGSKRQIDRLLYNEKYIIRNGSVRPAIHCKVK